MAEYNPMMFAAEAKPAARHTITAELFEAACRAHRDQWVREFSSAIPGEKLWNQIDEDSRDDERRSMKAALAAIGIEVSDCKYQINTQASYCLLDNCTCKEASNV